MKNVSLFISIVLITFVSCHEAVKQPGILPDSVRQEIIADTMTATLSTHPDMPPKSVDGLFDDFIYSFMTNRAFQMQRINFPLSVTDARSGHKSFIPAAQWKHDRLYSIRQTYVIIYDDAKAQSREKDTKTDRATVEWINFPKKSVKQYLFARQNGLWKLIALRYEAFKQNANADFLNFYQRFATDSVFQRKHVAATVNFTTYDTDNFEMVEGVVDVDQWFAFKPDLPYGEIANVNYGQLYRNSLERIMVINGLSNSMHSSLVFKRKGGQWILTKFEN